MAKKTKESLGKKEILNTAITFLESYDIESLSMRKIATHLNCGTMSLYNHIHNKDDLLEEMVDFILTKLSYPTKRGTWKRQLKKLLLDTHEILLAHTWAPGLWLKTMPKKNRINFMNKVLEILSQSNLTEDARFRGYCAITMHLIGFTMQEIAYQKVLGDNMENIALEFAKSLPSDCIFLSEYIHMRIEKKMNNKDFEFVLDLILNGLEATSEK